MTRYQGPSLENLKKAALEIANKYTEKGNQDRTDQITLLKNLVLQLENNKMDAHTARDILLGALIFIHHSIQKSYDLPVPTTVAYISSFFSSFSPISYNANNSELFRLLNEALLLDDASNKDKKEKNTLNSPPGDPDADPTKFICLGTFLKYVENKRLLLSDDSIKQLQEMVKEAKQPLEGKITHLCEKLSAEKSLQEGFSSLATTYQSYCAKDFCSPEYKSTYLLYLAFGRNSNRLKDIQFLEALDAHLKATNASLEERDFMLKGAAVKIMAGIENEYKFSLRSPERSDLYRLLQQKTGLKRSSQCIEFSQAYLAALHKTVCTAVLSEEQLAFWKKHEIEKAALDQAKSDIVTLQNELDQAKKGVHVSDDLRFNTIINKLFDTLASSIANTGVLVVIANLIATASHTNLTTLLTVASPQNTLLMMGAIYAAQHLRGPISTAITSAITPVVKPVLLAPVNAALTYNKKPSFFQSGSKLTEEDYKLFVMHYYLCSPMEKENIAATIDITKLTLAAKKQMKHTDDLNSPRPSTVLVH